MNTVDSKGISMLEEYIRCRKEFIETKKSINSLMIVRKGSEDSIERAHLLEDIGRLGERLDYLSERMNSLAW